MNPTHNFHCVLRSEDVGGMSNRISYRFVYVNKMYAGLCESYVWDESSGFGKTDVCEMQNGPAERSAVCYL